MAAHHRINYIEFSAPNLEVIKTFYSKTFGWTFTDYGPEYAAFNDGTLDGGFSKGPSPKSLGAIVILYSENLENSLSIVKKYGGAIVKEIYKFPGGRRFHFTDPAGNELAVWSQE